MWIDDWSNSTIFPSSYSTYTTYGFKKRLESAGMTQSMLRVGRCIDNGPIEGYWGTLKCEKYYLNKYNTFEELKNDIDKHIYFYNYKRLQL